MAGKPICRSLVKKQVRFEKAQVSFKKVLRIYRKMQHSYPVYELPYGIDDYAFVRVKHYNVDKGSELTYIMGYNNSEFSITGIIVCGTCAGDKGSVISSENPDIPRYPCGICHQRKPSESLKYKVIVKNIGEESAMEFRFKLSLEMAGFWHFPGSLHEVVVLSRHILEMEDSCEGIGDFPSCHQEEFYLGKDRYYFCIITFLKISNE